MRAVFEELYYAASNQKIADEKKANYQEALEKSLADSAARSFDSYTERSGEKLHTKPQKLYEVSGKELC